MFVKSIVNIPSEFNSDGSKHVYGLSKGRIYKVAKPNQIPKAPNNDEFIYVIHSNGAVIPHLPDSFMSVDEWRNEKLKDLDI